MKRSSSVRAYGVLVEAGQVLLVRSSNPRHDPPLWWLPGGGINFGETPESAVLREFGEETGLAVHSPRLLLVTSDLRRRDNGDQIHAMRICYTVESSGGRLIDEVEGTTDRATWYGLDALASLNVAGYARAAIAAAQGK
ncbi:MAG: NUDIX hydrolase [Acidimicrobiales bacterium]